MDAVLLLEKVNKLQNVKSLVSLLEVKFLSDEYFLPLLKAASKSLDKSLLHLVFDIQKKLANPMQARLLGNKISNELSNAIGQLKDFNDEALKRSLYDLTEFVQAYENDSNPISSTTNRKDLENLKIKILFLISERFG